MMRAATPFVGRRRELDIVRRFLSRFANDGGALLLTGDSGVGKSALLDWTVATATADGVLVLSADGVELEAEMPFAALNQALLPTKGSFDLLSPPQRDVLSSAVGFREGPVSSVPVVAAAAAALLRLMSSQQPVLLVVDDLQSVDKPSTAVFDLIARHLADTRAGFLAAAATDFARRFVDPNLPRLELGPLDPDAASDLLRTRFPTLADRVARRVAAEACGYPLALIEWPAAMSEQERTAQSPLPQQLPLTARLQAVFTSDIAAMPARTRRILLHAALANGDDRPSVGASAATADLAPAQRAGLISVDPETSLIDFPHPLISPTIVALSTTGERRHAHRELASLAGTAEGRAWHLGEATVEPDAEVAQLVELAADRMLGRGDQVRGVTALLRSAELSTQPSENSRRMARAAYAEAKLGGNLDTAAGLLSEARRIDPGSTTMLNVAVATAYLALHTDGDVEGAHRLLTDAIVRRTATSQVVDRSLVEAFEAWSEICAYGGLSRLRAPLEELIGRIGSEMPSLARLLISGVADLGTTSTEDVIGLDGAVSRLGDDIDPSSICRVSAAALRLDRTGLCRNKLEKIAADGLSDLTIGPALRAMMLLASDSFHAGRWPEAEQWADAGLELCAVSGHRLLAQQFRLSNALVAAAKGELDTARSTAVEIDGWAAPRNLGALQSQSAHVRTLAALGQGDFELAYQQASTISPAGTLMPNLPAVLSVALDLVESAVRTKRHSQAVRHVDALRASGTAELSPRLAMVVAASAGLTAAGDDARVLFEEALALPGVERWPFELARVQLIYGERLRRVRAPAEARPHLEAAFDTFNTLRAKPWMARARKELNATGLTAVDVDGFRVDPLTPQEQEVAMLAASGLSNRRIAEQLYVSHRTVGAHLRQVFPKLGIISRASLRDALGYDALTV